MNTDELNQAPAESRAEAETSSERKRKPYRTPVLRVYGSVSKLTTGSGSPLADGNKKKKPASDPKLKENVVRIGNHPLGIGLYLFDYKSEYREQWGRGRQFGVMADEVEAAMPEAVCVHPDGYKMVDYAMLGVKQVIHE